MSEDEINIANKLCNIEEIAIAESDRDGFNHMYESIGSAVFGGLSAFLMSFGSCAIIFCGSALLVTFAGSIYTLTRLNSTQTDKIFSYIGLGLGGLALFFYFTGWA